jgi:hypothetical protein
MNSRHCVLALICAAATARADVAVLTQHNNLARTGANLEETVLNTTTVNLNRFGLVFTRTVDDQVYAQPLVMTNVDIPGNGPHNVVYVATVNDSVYAFDADDPAASTPYWQVSFTNANAVPPCNTDMTGACGGNYIDFSGNMGIVSTPVIDPGSETIYVLVRTKEFGAAFVQRLHALDIRTGAEMTNSPVTITATCAGNGDGSSANVLAFDPQKQNQRSALSLIDGVLYFAWASHCDWGPYHGWVAGYDATTLQQVVLYNDTPNGTNGGIWMSGQGIAADTNGNLFLSVGNGTVGYNGNPRDVINRGESFLKLTRAGTNLTVASWFTPNNYSSLDGTDSDLGSAGILLIPNTTLALSGGKQGVLYLVNRDNMGGLSFTTSDTNVIQSFQVASGAHQILGSPVWWDGPDGSYGYIWVSASDFLRQYKFDPASGKFLLPNYAQSTTAAPGGTPGGILSISANGTNAGSGIVWASHQLGGSANQAVRPGILRAFNAQNVTNELWNSELVSARDSVGNFAKFCPPTVANGKVYLATFSGRLDVYGLLPLPSLVIGLSDTSVTLSWHTNGFSGYTVQAATNLSSPVWQNLTNSVMVTNGTFEVAVPPSGDTVFYRLKR